MSLETKTFAKGQGIFFPSKKGGTLSKKAYTGVKISLIDNVIIGESYLPKPKPVIEIPLKNIIYAKAEIKKIRKLYFIRIGYKEGEEEKEIFLSLPKKDFELWKKSLKCE